MSFCMKLDKKRCKEDSDCQNDGTCVDDESSPGKKKCKCKLNFSGDNCEVDGKYLKPWMYSLFEK